MIEQLYSNTDKQELTENPKRISLTDELQRLAREQERLEAQRSMLKTSIETAFTLFAPLKEQMKDVVSCMERFHELETSYAALSKQTYEDIHNDIQAIGNELLQTQNLLNEGTKLTNSGIEIPKLQLPNEFLPKAETKEDAKDIIQEEEISDFKQYDTEEKVEKETLTDEMDVDKTLDAMFDELGLNNTSAVIDNQAFYDKLSDIVSDDEKMTVVADATQDSALVEVSLPSEVTDLHTEFKYRVAENEQLRIRGNYIDGVLSLSYTVMREDNSASPILADLITTDTTDRIKACIQPEIDWMLQAFKKSNDKEVTVPIEEGLDEMSDLDQ